MFGRSHYRCTENDIHLLEEMHVMVKGLFEQTGESALAAPKDTHGATYSRMDRIREQSAKDFSVINDSINSELSQFQSLVETLKSHSSSETAPPPDLIKAASRRFLAIERNVNLLTEKCRYDESFILPVRASLKAASNILEKLGAHIIKRSLFEKASGWFRHA